MIFGYIFYWGGISIVLLTVAVLFLVYFFGCCKKCKVAGCCRKNKNRTKMKAKKQNSYVTTDFLAYETDPLGIYWDKNMVNEELVSRVHEV